jgi:O-methyltransferase domain/Dimerisation domain
MSKAEQPGSAGSKPPQAVLLEMLTGFWTSQAIHVAAQLGIADLLRDGPRTADDLARAAGAHGRSLYRLLRALASVGVFAEDGAGRFGLTPLAACLRSDVPGSQRATAIAMGEEHYRAWGDLLYSVRTGQTAFDHLYGKPIFQYLADNPRAAQLFDEMMTGVHGAETAAMLEVYDFTPIGTLVDVGGGNGTTLAAVLARDPLLHGILFDRPDVIERAREPLKAAGMEYRCLLVGGDFFASVPVGGDAYLLRHILHDWNDGQCLTILGNIRKAMLPRAKLLIVESVIPPGNEPCFAKFLDVNMLAIPGGMERTAEEYRQLLQGAGFKLSRIIPTRMEVSVIEGEIG